MTLFRVEWKDAALDMLADIWMQAINRAAVNAAQTQIDALYDSRSDRSWATPFGRTLQTYRTSSHGFLHHR
jgi:hypothetical protein